MSILLLGDQYCSEKQAVKPVYPSANYDSVASATILLIAFDPLVG